MYKNPNYRKIRGSYILLVSCGSCKTDIAKYQKLGRGNVLRLYIERIIELSTELSQELTCSKCGVILGSKVVLKRENREFYKMIRSKYNIRKFD